MNASRIVLVLILLALESGGKGVTPVVRFELPVSPIRLVTDEGAFRPFAEAVGAEVERLLGIPQALDDPATFKPLLSIRVHLAHHFGENEKAVATAAWIRSLQTDPVARSFAGLTTFASVEARRRHPGVPPTEPAYRKTFLEAFQRQLSPLPRSQAVVTMLKGQREKIAAITEEALLKETRTLIGPAIERRGYCGMEEADQLVRVRHRLSGIVPVRAETLQALDAAIAARTSP